MAKKIGVDIGHGKNTFPPSKGVYKNGIGYHEHNFNSAVGVIAEKRLKEHGFQTVKAQKEYSNEVSLKDRVALYNKEKCDLVLSFHGNAGDKAAKGMGVFYWYNSDTGLKFAKLFKDNFVNMTEGIGLWSSGIWKCLDSGWSNFYIVENTSMPCCLLELGFMTNDHDFEYIFGAKKDKYIEQCAEATVKSVCDYFGVKYTELKEEEEMEKNAIVMNSFADYVYCEPLQNKLGCGIFSRGEASKREVAQNVIVVGGTKDGIKGKVTLLSGADRFETGEKVKAYLK